MNVTVNLYGEFSVLGADGAPTNNSMILYVINGRALYTTGYVSGIAVNASFVLNLGDGYAAYLIIKANPLNNQPVSVFWNTDLRICLKLEE